MSARANRIRPSTYWRAFATCVLALIPLALLSALPLGATERSKTVLAIYDQERLLPANMVVDSVLRDSLGLETDNPPTYLSEFLDVSRFGSSDYDKLLSGRTVARSGLRMMPTFPLSPLSFRTAGFPQYGWKVGLSGSAFPHVAQVKPAPGIPCSTRRFASAFRALRCPTLRPALCRNSGLGGALPFEESTPLPQRSSLRSGFYCPSPSTLNRPHPPHS